MISYVQRNWARLLVSPAGTFVRGVPLRVLAFGLISLVVWLLDRRGLRVTLPLGLHEVGGATIALFLAFRTNTAYARFWEGRTLWGGVVNSCRNVTRIVGRYARQDPAEAREFAAWAVTFAHAMRRGLRGQSGFPELESVLSPEHLAALRRAPHPALFAASEMSRRIAELAARGALEPMMAQQAEAEVVALVNYLGGCERIAKTPTPLGYVLLAQRFIALYLASLPFALVERLGGFTPFVIVAVAYPVLMIEGLGNELDNPFGHDANDLPLTRICSTIQLNLLGSAPPPDLAHARPEIVL